MKVLCVLGTRPEAIKMATLINELKSKLGNNLKVCVTAQHRQMLDQVLNFFSIIPDYDLNLMQDNQDLIYLSHAILKNVSNILEDFKPDRVVVQGDTTTTFFTALAAYYARIPIVHLEAGLRSGNLYAPWPEEANRKLTTHLADFHFAPTEQAAENLRREGVDNKKIFVTGNTVIDALFYAKQKLFSDDLLLQKMQTQFSFLDKNKKLILVTGHRRENFGEGFFDICNALAQLANNPNLQIVYPVHLNPNVQIPVRQLLSHLDNVFLLEPVDYLPFIYLMDKSYLILTDSGGIQEEAPSLGKPVLLMRDVSERPEGILAGTVKIVGTDARKILQEANRLIHEPEFYKSMSLKHNPYGDGKATGKIINILLC